MRRNKQNKQAIDEQLLDSLMILEQEWKQIRSLMDKSIEPMEASLNYERLAMAKYLFLLREARHRNINAMRYRR